MIQCPACDWALDPDAGDSGVLGLLGTGVVGQDVEAQVAEHLSQHSVMDWVKACVEADATIDVLSDRIEDLETQLGEAQQMLARPLPAFSAPHAPSMPGPPPGYSMPALDQQLPAGVALWPDGRMRVDPDKTLIALVPPGQRAEGQVGRRT